MWELEPVVSAQRVSIHLENRQGAENYSCKETRGLFTGSLLTFTTNPGSLSLF